MAGDPKDQGASGNAGPQGTAPNEPTPAPGSPAAPAPNGGATPPGAESGGKPSGVDSANKTPEEAAAQAAVGVPGSEKGAEAASRGVALNHGEPDPAVEEARKARVEAAKDPWGTTPMQMRDVHDEAVDPAKVGVATRPDGSGLVDSEGKPLARPTEHAGLV